MFSPAMAYHAKHSSWSRGHRCLKSGAGQAANPSPPQLPEAHLIFICSPLILYIHGCLGGLSLSNHNAIVNSCVYRGQPTRFTSYSLTFSTPPPLSHAMLVTSVCLCVVICMSSSPLLHFPLTFYIWLLIPLIFNNVINSNKCVCSSLRQ